MLIDKLINWLLDRKSPLSWVDYRMNRIMRKNPAIDIPNFNQASSILSREIIEIKEKFSNRY